MTNWTPVTQQLPDTGLYGISDTVLVCYRFDERGATHVGAGRYHTRDKTWRVYGQNALHPIIALAWMALPEPPTTPAYDLSLKLPVDPDGASATEE